MTTKDWEDKIIALLEGGLSITEQQQLMAGINQDPNLLELWKSYAEMYELIEESPAESPSLESKKRFNQFLTQEVEKEAKNSAQIVPIFAWKKIASVAALFIGALCIWNLNFKDERHHDSSSMVNTKLRQSLKSNSSTEKIKAIRVNYNQPANQVDQEMIYLLVNVLQKDRSSNVRLAAVEALHDFIEVDLVRKSLINALSLEQDGFVKLSIIKALGSRFDKDVRKTFKQMLKTDDNEQFIQKEIEKELFKHARIKL